MRLGGKLTSIVDPIDRIHFDYRVIVIERWRYNHHDEYFEIKRFFTQHVPQRTCSLEILRQILFADHSNLDLALYDCLIESYGVLVVLPHSFEVELDDNRS